MVMIIEMSLFDLKIVLLSEVQCPGHQTWLGWLYFTLCVT
jgi:hypothetical protein